jgi:hypothetical protein
MKSKILFAMLLGSLFFAGCSTLLLKEPVKPVGNQNEQKLSFFTQISQLLKTGATIEEIDNPKIALPADINEGQIKKYFKLDNIVFALVLRNSMNVVLSLPNDFTPSFVGVLVAEQGDKQWTKFLEIKDSEPTSKNNPYYLMVDSQKLLLTVVDQNGAGSGEGIMKVFALTETSSWNLESCYYFGRSYSDPSIDGDYFAFSTKFSRQTWQPIEVCNNVQLIPKE